MKATVLPFVLLILASCVSKAPAVDPPSSYPVSGIVWAAVAQSLHSEHGALCIQSDEENEAGLFPTLCGNCSQATRAECARSEVGDYAHGELSNNEWVRLRVSLAR